MHAKESEVAESPDHIRTVLVCDAQQITVHERRFEKWTRLTDYVISIIAPCEQAIRDGDATKVSRLLSDNPGLLRHPIPWQAGLQGRPHSALVRGMGGRFERGECRYRKRPAMRRR